MKRKFLVLLGLVTASFLSACSAAPVHSDLISDKQTNLGMSDLNGGGGDFVRDLDRERPTPETIRK